MPKGKTINPPTKELASAIFRHGALLGNVRSPLQISQCITSYTEIQRDGRLFDPGELRAADLRIFLEMGGFAANAAKLTDLLYRGFVHLTIWGLLGTETGKSASTSARTIYGATMLDPRNNRVLQRIIVMSGPRETWINERAVVYLEACAGMFASTQLNPAETLFMRA